MDTWGTVFGVSGICVFGPVVVRFSHGVHPGQADGWRLIVTQLPGSRGESLVQRSSALLRKRPVKLLAGGAATGILHNETGGVRTAKAMGLRNLP
jgi:hypothetical protein